MSLNRSLGWGIVLAIGVTVITLGAGFVAGASLDIPGVVQMSSADGAPNTSFSFNPLATLALAIVIGLAIWAVSRARGSDSRSHPHAQEH